MNKNDNYRHLIILFLCGLLLLSTDASAADKVLDVTQIDQDAVSLTEYFAVLEDPGLTLTLADVQKTDMANRFKGGHAPTMALSYGFVRSAYWLRLTLRNTGDRPVERMLEIGYPLLSSIQFHQPLADGGYRSLDTGNAMPYETRAYPNRNFVFPVTLPERSERVIYLRVQSASSMIIPATLWQSQAFQAHVRNDYVVQAWYLGIATAMILFNLLLFIALWDAIYLLYVNFAICTVLTVSSGSGLGKEFLWPDTMLWSDIAASVGYSLMIAALLLFMRSLLNTRELIPKLDRLIRIVIGIDLLLPFGYAVSLHTVAAPFTIFNSFAGALILCIGLYCAFFKRQRIAVYFVAAFSIFLCGGLMVGLRILNLLPANFFTMNGLLFGSASEMLLLAFALADRFNMIRRKAIDDVAQANINLEQRLQEREAELTESHTLLREIEQRQTLSQERQRLMQDMHDGLGSSLVSALRVVENGRMDETVVAQVLKGCIDDLKLAIDSMEAVDADLLLLLATLRYRLEPRLESSGIALLWQVANVPALDWLDPKNALHILRILQEVFTNIIKHTQATEIRVATRVDGDYVLVTITDNGHGFSVESALKSGGKGLSNQTRRAEAIGAEVSWDSNDAGTCFTLRLPG